MAADRELRLRLLCLQGEAERAGLQTAAQALAQRTAVLRSVGAVLRGAPASPAGARLFSLAAQVLRLARQHALASAGVAAAFKWLWRRPRLALAATGAALVVLWWTARR
jgi:hypothetical protein